MGLDIWSYDKDKIAAFSKYNYIKNQFDIFISSNRTKYNELYPEHFCDSQYLRSAYNNYGYDSMADIYQCIPMLSILEPMVNSLNNNKYITKESIHQSLGIARENLHRWIYLQTLNDVIYRYEVLKYNENAKFNTIFDTIMSAAYIQYNGLTCDIIDLAKNNLNKFKFKKYLKHIPDHDIEEIKGILEVDNQIIILLKDDIKWYKETAEIIVDFIETILLMEEPTIGYWG